MPAKSDFTMSDGKILDIFIVVLAWSNQWYGRRWQVGSLSEIGALDESYNNTPTIAAINLSGQPDWQ